MFKWVYDNPLTNILAPSKKTDNDLIQVFI